MTKKNTKAESGSYWNYRVVADFNNVEQEALRQWSFTIRDVYYTNGEPTSWGAEPQYPCGESVVDVYNDLHHMEQAIQQPLLIERGDKLVEFTGARFASTVKPHMLKAYEPLPTNSSHHD